MHHRSRVRRRRVRALVVGVVAASSIVVGSTGGTAAAAPTTGSSVLIPPGTVYALPGLQPAAADILIASVRYDRTVGSVTASLTFRGPLTRGTNGGPSYQVELSDPGPRGTTPLAVLLNGRGVPLVTDGAIQYTNTPRPDTLFAVGSRVTGNRMVLTATDARLKNLPLTEFEVYAFNDGRGGVTSPLSVDYVTGPLG